MKLDEIFDDANLKEKIFPSLTPPHPRIGKPLRKEKIKPTFSNQKIDHREPTKAPNDQLSESFLTILSVI